MNGFSLKRRGVAALGLGGGLVLAALVSGITGCGHGDTDGAGAAVMSVDRVPREKWEKLASARVLFGHQSVGFNIVEGLGRVLKEKPELRLRIVEWTGDQSPAGPAFVYAKCGVNKRPATKIDAFEGFIADGRREPFDVAFFKFCYADIEEGTAVEALFEQYRSALAALEAAHPRTVFVHVTTPLTVVQRGPKAWIKGILGRPAGGYADNAARNRFNALLRREYAKSRPVFDLAALESTYADGRRETYRFRGETFEALVPEYASDGRHLNETGQKRLAEGLLALLVEVADGPGPRGKEGTET